MTEYSAQPNFQYRDLPPAGVSTKISDMPKKGPYRKKTIARPRRKIFLSEWRIFRGLTVEELATRSGMSTGNISNLQTGKQGYSDEGLQKLAKALDIDVGSLLEVDPLADREMWSVWTEATPEQRAQITAIARTFVKPNPLKQ